MAVPVAEGDAVPLPPGLPPLLPVQEAPPDAEARGYVRMAVMDGKTIGHRVRNICSVAVCYETESKRSSDLRSGNLHATTKEL